MKKLMTTIILSMGLSVAALPASAHQPTRNLDAAIDRSCEYGKVKLILANEHWQKINATVSCEDAKKLSGSDFVKAHGIHLVE